MGLWYLLLGSPVPAIGANEFAATTTATGSAAGSATVAASFGGIFFIGLTSLAT